MLFKRTFRSRPYDLVTAIGSTVNIDRSFLDSAIGQFKFPVITRLLLRVIFNGDTGTDGLPARFLPRIFQKIQLNDGVGERVAIAGSSYRAFLQNELGRSFVPGRFVTASSNDVDVEMFLPIVLNPPKAKRPRDYGIPLKEFINGGRLDLSVRSALVALGGAQGITAVNSGKIEVYAEVEEQRTPELKARMVVKDYLLTKPEDTVPVGGSLRTFGLYIGEDLEDAGTMWTDQTISSDTLQAWQIPGSVRAEQYQEDSNTNRGVDQIASAQGDDMILTQNVATATRFTNAPRFFMPFAFPERDAKLPSLPPMQSMHYKLDGGALQGAQGKIVVASITGRDPNMSALTLGCSPDEVLQKIEASGVIKTADGSAMARDYNNRLRSIMPTKVKRGVQSAQ